MKEYISVDVELSGREIGKHSMISIGAAVVGRVDEQFYREIKPLSYNFEYTAMRVATQGLNCLNSNLRKVPEYDSFHRFFRPNLILKVLYKKGMHPQQTMQEFNDWILNVSSQKEAIMIAKPARVDFPVIKYYFKRFLGNNGPFGEEGCLDLETEYQQLANNSKGSLRLLGLIDTRLQQHNALDDAIYQAEQYNKILTLKQFKEDNKY